MSGLVGLRNALKNGPATPEIGCLSKPAGQSWPWSVVVAVMMSNTNGCLCKIMLFMYVMITAVYVRLCSHRCLLLVTPVGHDSCNCPNRCFCPTFTMVNHGNKHGTRTHWVSAPVHRGRCRFHLQDDGSSQRCSICVREERGCIPSSLSGLA